jgi:prolyl oligopeptidase PreP (S9A serine peptidase family)
MRRALSVRRKPAARCFTVPVAKQEILWKDVNSLSVATDFGEGSLTPSG